MPKIELITNVSEFGLFRSVAESRLRLVGATVAGVAASYAAGMAAAHYIFEYSKSVGLNLGIITAVMMLVLVASYLLALLIGDVFFPGPWRQQVVLGRDSPDGRVSVADHNAEFIIILLLAVVANAVALNWATRGFLDRYQNEGFYAVQLRSDEADERLRALENIADPLNFEQWENPGLQAIVVDAFDDASPEVRRRAYWTAGHLDIETAQPTLVGLLDEPISAGDKAAAAVAVGELGKPDVAGKALERLAVDADDPVAKVGALRGLGLLADAGSIDTLTSLAGSDNPRVMAHAFWALRQIGSSRARPFVRGVVDDQPAGMRRCAAYDTLKMVATQQDVLWARRAFQRSDNDQAGDFECDNVVWTEPDTTQHYIVYGDSFREKLLKIVANVAAADHRAWFQRLVNDSSEPFRIRQVANEVLRQLEQGV